MYVSNSCVSGDSHCHCNCEGGRGREGRRLGGGREGGSGVERECRGEDDDREEGGRFDIRAKVWEREVGRER